MGAGLLVVLLVVLLGSPERAERRDLRRHGLAEARLLLRCGRPRRCRLGVREREDGAPVLIADVGALAVLRRRIVVHEEDAKEVVVGDLRRVVLDEDRLGEPAWYLTAPRRAGVTAVRCDGAWISVAPPAEPAAGERVAASLALSGQTTDRPALRHLGSEIAYLRLPTFSKTNAETILRERSSWDKPNGRERALIVNLRGNDGGDAMFPALEGWVSKEDIVASARFDRRVGASCLYPALRWGYTSASSFGLASPLEPAMRDELQSSLDALAGDDDPRCPAKFLDQHAPKPLRDPRPAPTPRRGKPLLVVLVDERCASDCEHMTATLAKLPEAVLVGTSTFGVAQFIQPGYSVLPNTRLPFRIALGTSDMYGDDRSVDGHGIDVDVILDGERAWQQGGILSLVERLTAPPHGRTPRARSGGRRGSASR